MGFGVVERQHFCWRDWPWERVENTIDIGERREISDLREKRREIRREKKC